MNGMSTSVMTRSKSHISSHCSASRPLLAATRVCSASARIRERRTTGSSSTMRRWAIADQFADRAVAPTVDVDDSQGFDGLAMLRRPVAAVALEAVAREALSSTVHQFALDDL